MRYFNSLIMTAILFAVNLAPVSAAYVNLQTITITTDSSGDATEYTSVVTGCVHQIRYVPDGASPLATGADLDITLETTGVIVANQDNIGTSAFTVAYRQATHAVDGSASLYASSGEPIETPICVANERLKVVIASGGDTKSGTFYIWIN